MPRPVVNLDPIANAIDRVLDHPAAAVAGELLPQTVGALRKVRANLPAVASGLEARAVAHLRTEAAAIEQELLDGAQAWISEAIAGARKTLKRRARKRAKKKAEPKRLRGKR